MQQSFPNGAIVLGGEVNGIAVIRSLGRLACNVARCLRHCVPIMPATRAISWRRAWCP
jgi:hypothetical protein